MNDKTRQQRIACPLSPWAGRDNACQWCDIDLPATGRRSAWCTDACRRAWERNHLWSRARATARRRDKYACARCGQHKTSAAIEVNHIHPVAAHSGASHGRTPSCAHHQTNLEVLCKDCHLVETNRQRAEGLFKKSAPGEQTL